MIILKPIGYKLLRQHICEGFLDDADLLKRFAHKAHRSAQEMVDVNLQAIRETGATEPLDLYAVLARTEDGTLRSIGFTVLSVRGAIRVLYSYAINIEWRKREVLLEWLQAVEEKFGDKRYGVACYCVNSRAINFFRKNGFTNEKIAGNSIILWQ